MSSFRCLSAASRGIPKAMIIAPIAALMLVWLPVVAHAAALPANCTGSATDGDDTIVCGDLHPGDVINAGKGNDKITINGTIPLQKNVKAPSDSGAIVIHGGAGDDTITVKGDVPQGTFLYGDAGNDTIEVGTIGLIRRIQDGDSTPGGYVDGGAGDDTITSATLTGTGALLGGDGKDTINVKQVGYIDGRDAAKGEQGTETYAGYLDGGAGDDSITAGWIAMPGDSVYPQHKGGVFGGAGNDRITVGTAAGFGRAHGGDGNDTITADLLISGYLDGDGGNDTITAKKITFTGEISGGDGDDVLHADSIQQTGRIDGGNGNDQVTVGTMNGADIDSIGVTAANVSGGAGNDTIKVDVVGMQSSVGGDEGDDTIEIGQLNGPKDPYHKCPPGTHPPVNPRPGQPLKPGECEEDKIDFHKGIVRGDAGNDKITIQVLGKSGRVWGDSYEGNNDVTGNDTIIIGQINAEGQVRGGPGADQITVNGPVSPKGSVLGEQGNDTLIVNGKNDGLVDGGPGTDKCRVNSGNKTQNCEGTA